VTLPTCARGFLGGCALRNERLADHPARLFLCARCRVPVLLCSPCDRGQIYCCAQCSGEARKSAQTQAARRYQNGRTGRLAHAARSKRWRQRQRTRSADLQLLRDDEQEIVTHQGSIEPAGNAPLVACDIEPGNPLTQATLTTQASIQACWRCRRCSKEISSWVRQGFLRHAVAPRRLVASHDHSP